MAVPRPAPPVSPACATALCNALPVLFSPVSLSGGLLSAVAGFPLRAGFTRRCPFPLSGAAGSYHLASLTFALRAGFRPGRIIFGLPATRFSEKGLKRG